MHFPPYSTFLDIQNLCLELACCKRNITREVVRILPDRLAPVLDLVLVLDPVLGPDLDLGLDLDHFLGLDPGHFPDHFLVPDPDPDRLPRVRHPLRVPDRDLGLDLGLDLDPLPGLVETECKYSSQKQNRLFK